MDQNPLAVIVRSRGQGSLTLDVKDAHVDTACLGVTPAQVPGRHHQRRLIPENLAQLMQLTAQVSECLPIGRVWPEQAGDPLAGLGRPGMRDQKPDEGNRARRTYPHAGPVVGDYLLPQHRNLQHLNAASSGPG